MYESKPQKIEHIELIFNDTGYFCTKCNTTAPINGSIIESRDPAGELIYSLKCKSCEYALTAADAYKLAANTILQTVCNTKTDLQLPSFWRLWVCAAQHCGTINVPQTQPGVLDAENAPKSFKGSYCKACLNECTHASVCFDRPLQPAPAAPVPAPMAGRAKRKLGEIADSIVGLGRRVKAKFHSEDRPTLGTFGTLAGPEMPFIRETTPAPTAPLLWPDIDEQTYIALPDPAREIAHPIPRKKAKFLNERDAFQLPSPVPNLVDVPYPRNVNPRAPPAVVIPGNYFTQPLHFMPQIQQAETLPPILPRLRIDTQVAASRLPPQQLAFPPLDFDFRVMAAPAPAVAAPAVAAPAVVSRAPIPFVAGGDGGYQISPASMECSPLAARLSNPFDPVSAMSLTEHIAMDIDSYTSVEHSPVSPLEEDEEL